MTSFYTLLFGHIGLAQDTLRVMAYNVLHYGDGCQGSNKFLHTNLKTIVQYESSDVVGLVKVQVIKLSANDFVGISPVGFADSILVHAFQAAYPGKYDYCPVVNFSNDPDADMDLLFYDKNKLGFVSITNLCAIQEDFNLYKLYYRDPNLPITKDTTFLYFILNHTVSGTSSSSRNTQDTMVIKNLKKTFSHVPNLISMGDFNTHSSLESGYQLLTTSTDTSFTFFDPPYSPDNKLSYPSNWSANAEAFSGYLNTSTREVALPNACGTANGAKGWYLHILLSPWIVKNKNYVNYIPNSYATIGNDGNRLGISINDSINVKKNITVPPHVLNSLYNLSDKYPVMIKLVVNQNTSGISPLDPVLTPSTETFSTVSRISTDNPIDQNIIIMHFPPSMLGNQVAMEWFDLSGRSIEREQFAVISTTITRSVDLNSGVYILCLKIKGDRYSTRIIRK